MFQVPLKHYSTIIFVCGIISILCIILHDVFLEWSGMLVAIGILSAIIAITAYDGLHS